MKETENYHFQSSHNNKTLLVTIYEMLQTTAAEYIRVGTNGRCCLDTNTIGCKKKQLKDKLI